MSKNLCIDWGNSRVKVALFEGKNLDASFNFSSEEAGRTIRELVEAQQPANAILCQVARADSELIDFLGEATQLTIMNAETPTPIMNAYSSMHTLGMDRLALAVGVQDAFPDKNNLVICVGSAITYNFCQKSGIFRGGNISPGMRMRFRALAEYADQLPLVDEDGELLLLGYDTATGIRSGVLYGIASEIDGMINRYRTEYSDFNAVLTGGDSALFEDKLKNKTFADQLLLLKGLNSILLHNAR